MGVIKVDHFQQVDTNLCWAACTKMFLKHYDIDVSQTTLEYYHDETFKHGLNNQADHNEVSHILNRYGIPAIDTAMGNEARLTWDTLKTAINNNRLIIAGRNGHDYLICGWEEPQHYRILHLHDPDKAQGPNRANYDTFKDGWRTTVMLSQSSVHALD